LSKALPSRAASILFAADISRMVNPAQQKQGATGEQFHLPAPERPPASRGPSRDRRTLGDWISAWWPVVLGICVISLESTVLFGSDNTSGPLRRVWEYIFGQVTDQRWEILHHYIRKTGHFVGYGTMGVLWLRALWMSLPRAGFLVDATLALLGTAMVASADEFHQSFLPNRTGVPSDVLLDCCGAIVLLLLSYLFLRLRAPKRLKSRSAFLSI
jgi:VanZ family protein